MLVLFFPKISYFTVLNGKKRHTSQVIVLYLPGYEAIVGLITVGAPGQNYEDLISC